jgi:ABC-type transport system involved in multi-copper enzyme maturation permease subunit
MLPRFISPGPLFALEMVTSARRTRYFVIRVLYAVVLLLFLWNIFQAFDRPYNSADDIATIARFSWTFFGFFSMLQLLTVVAAGPAMTAGAIATERERRTIEYLFASTLSNAEIILGKLLARLVQVGYLVLAGMPILFIAMLMGGIAPEAIILLTILTISTALTVSIISITVSVWSARAREAVVRAYLVVIVLFVLPPMMLNLRGTWFYDAFLDPLNEQLLIVNPFYMLGNMLVTASSANTAVAWNALLALLRNQAVVCVLGITASTCAVRRVHLKASGSAPKKRRRKFRFFRPVLGDRPMLWKEIVTEPAASRLGVVGRIAMLLILAAIIGITLIGFFEAEYSPGYVSKSLQIPSHYFFYCIYMGALVGSGGLLLIAARAAGAITSEKERDCWVPLISTPLEPHEIILGKIAGNLWAARGIFVVLAIIWGLGAVLDPGFLLAIAFMMITLLILAVYASGLGVLFSLWCRTSMRAMAATLATALFAGGFYLCCCIPLTFGNSRFGNEAIIILSGCVPFLIGIPGGIYVDSISNHNMSEPVPNMIAAYILGTVGYAFAAVVLIFSSIKNFDRFSGRSGPMPWNPTSQKKPAESAPAHSAPKLVEEPIRAEIVE